MSNGHNRIELVPAEIKIIWSDETKCNEVGGDGWVGICGMLATINNLTNSIV